MMHSTLQQLIWASLLGVMIFCARGCLVDLQVAEEGTTQQAFAKGYEHVQNVGSQGRHWQRAEGLQVAPSVIQGIVTTINNQAARIKALEAGKR